MMGRDLGVKVFSFFDVVVLYWFLKNVGFSVILYVCDFCYDEDVGFYRVKKVFFLCFWFWIVRDWVIKYLIFYMENMYDFEKKRVLFFIYKFWLLKYIKKKK